MSYLYLIKAELVIVATKEEVVEIAIEIANGNMEVNDITSWLEEHTREMPTIEI